VELDLRVLVGQGFAMQTLMVKWLVKLAGDSNQCGLGAELCLNNYYN